MKWQEGDPLCREPIILPLQNQVIENRETRECGEPVDEHCPLREACPLKPEFNLREGLRCPYRCHHAFK